MAIHSLRNIIKCPKCGFEHDGLDLIDTGDQDGTFEHFCDGCDKPLVVQFDTVITFTTTCK